jgi:EmrB/QacA subfamily drug resistance transporter
LHTTQAVYEGRWKTLAVLCLSLVIIVMDNTILNVALPSLARDLGATNSQLQWIVDSYVIVFAGLLLTFGTIGDKFGRKGALSGGILLFGLGSIFAALSTTAQQLIAARAFTGIGGALIMPATLSILSNVFMNPKERAKAIAIWSACSGIGVVIGPVLGGFLLEHYSWHSVFWINLPLLAGAWLAGWMFVPKSRDPHSPRLDLVGAGLSIVGLSTLLWAIIEAPVKGWTSPEVIAAFSVAAVTMVTFVFWEKTREHPMLDVRFFANPRFSAANGAVTLTFFGMFGSLFLLTQWMQFVKGYSTLAAGVRVIPFAVGMGIAAPRTGTHTR